MLARIWFQRLSEAQFCSTSAEDVTWTGLLLHLAIVLLVNPIPAMENGSLTIAMTFDILADLAPNSCYLTIVEQVWIEFGLFVGGVLAMLPRIFAVMVALGVFLLAFAQMLLVSTRGSSPSDDINYVCRLYTIEQEGNQEEAMAYQSSAFVPSRRLRYGFIPCRSGEVVERDFEHSTLAKVLYGVFVFQPTFWHTWLVRRSIITKATRFSFGGTIWNMFWRWSTVPRRVRFRLCRRLELNGMD